MTKPKAILFLILLLLMQAPGNSQCPSTDPVKVMNVNDNGMNSLRWAITCVNNGASPLKTIEFQIPGAQPVIQPLSALPAITKLNALVDGSTQEVIIDGSNISVGANGITLNGPNITVRNLNIRNFSGPSLGNGIYIAGGNNNTVQENHLFSNRIGIGTGTNAFTYLMDGNFVGIDHFGAPAANSQGGISIIGVPSAAVVSNNEIANNAGPAIKTQAGIVYITTNTIYCNTGDGIDRTAAPLLPIITKANTQKIIGTASINRTIEVFIYSTAGCPGTPLQGKTHLGTVTTLADGSWTLPVSGQVAPGNRITATSTQNGNNTSEFATPVTVTDCSSFTAGIMATNSSCYQANDGTATATPTNLSFLYMWSNTDTGPTVANLDPGIYTVTITDTAGCSDTETTVITEPTELVTDIVANDVSCFTGTNGTATANPAGGTPPYTTYNWSNGQTTKTAINLAAGIYVVTVTDQHLCTTVQTTSIDQPAALGVGVATNNVSCSGDMNGTATAIPSGGTAPYNTYNWSNGQMLATATGLAAGTYTVTVTDSNLCTKVQTATITQPTALALNLTASSETFSGANNGSVIAFPNGGTPPFTFHWNIPSINDTLTGLPPGVYLVTVTDLNSCTIAGSATVNAFSCAALQPGLTQSNVLCSGGNNGTATVLPNGGALPYTYLWSNSQSSNTATSLTAGIYTVTITDQNGCVAVRTVTISQPAALSLSINATDETLEDAHDGQATASSNGGTPPFTYLWDNGATNDMLTNLAPGTYFVTVTDVNGCTTIGSATIAAGSGCFVAPVYVIFGPDQICGNTTFMLEAGELYTPDPVIKYLWTLPNGTTQLTTAPNLEVTATSSAFSGEYFVQHDSLGCLSIPVGGATVTVLTVDGLFAGNDTVVCNAGLVKLQAATVASGTGSWVSLGAATVDDPTKNPTVGRNLQVGPNAFVWQVALPNCPQAATDTVVYFLEKKPEVRDDYYTLQHAFDVAVMEVLLNDALGGLTDTQLVQISAPTVGTLELLSPKPRFRYTVAEDFRGTVTFQYAVCNLNSVCNLPCDTATVTIQVQNLPTVPTGLVVEDSGPNGQLTIRGINGFSRVEITIVDRWGDLVFQETDYDNENPWLGDYKRTGKYLPGGAYYYYLKAYEDSVQIGNTMTGAIHLFDR